MSDRRPFDQAKDSLKDGLRSISHTINEALSKLEREILPVDKEWVLVEKLKMLGLAIQKEVGSVLSPASIQP
jgi:hypothetical protein